MITNQLAWRGMQFGICNTCGQERESNEIYDKDCVEKGVQLGKIRKEVVRGSGKV